MSSGAALYNEIEPFAVQWLRNLSDAGHIATGTVDPRSIAELQPTDVAPFMQAHFFAGIGVWSYALKLAGWPDGTPVWTGSCPCQPFSPAGTGGGFDDPRHLWPQWFRLIRECRPPIVFGEQVEGPDGRAWLDLVSTDLEGIGYAFGAAILPAAGMGAPHARHRTYFVAYAAAERRNRFDALLRAEAGRRLKARVPQASRSGAAGDVADPLPAGRAPRRAGPRGRSSTGMRGAGGMGDSSRAGLEGRELLPERSDERAFATAGVVRGFWADAEWIPCADGKWRPTEPGTFPLVDEPAPRVGELRAYGNGIVAVVAATFIRAVMETLAGGNP